MRKIKHKTQGFMSKVGLVALRLQILSAGKNHHQNAVIQLSCSMWFQVTEIMCKETIIYFDKILFTIYRLQTIMILEGEVAGRWGGGLDTPAAFGETGTRMESLHTYLSRVCLIMMSTSWVQVIYSLSIKA